jgi:hemerythrin-like domain-containing protein
MMSVGSRRTVLVGAAGAGLGLVGCAKAANGESKAPAAESAEEDVMPAEDLMREHGVLNRILLIYDESARRIDAQTPLPLDALAKSADIVRRFIEEYHEKLEEEFLFPRFEKANRLVDLVATLRRQHVAGRTLTATIARTITTGTIKKAEDRKRLADALRSFARMYRPHEAREDTVLFPAVRSIVEPNELHDLGETFEAKEHQHFGKEGFEGIVQEVGTLERAFGLYELDQFTPRGLS